MFAIDDAVVAAGGDLINPRNSSLDRKKNLGTISFDTRQLVAGEVFVALSGEKRNGHEFISQALEKKAGAIIVDKAEWAKIPAQQQKKAVQETWVIASDNTLASIGFLSNAWRNQFDIPVFAVTGSNGKTTTKDILGYTLNQVAKKGMSFLYSQGSFNNNIGLPRTLSFLDKTHEGAVLELGTNHFGELEALAKIAQPNGAIITNIGDSHLEFLCDRRGVLKAKWELIDGLAGKERVWFVNRDDPILKRVESESHRGLHKVTYSRRDPKADYYAGIVDKLGPEDNFGYRVRFSGAKMSDEMETEIRLPGLHNVQNALAAFAIAVDFFNKSPSAVAEALRGFQPVSKYRSEIIGIKNGAYLFNDCYNANPSSVDAALRMVAEASEGRFMVAIGELLEVAGRPEEVHFRLGEAIAKSGAKAIGASGPHAEATIQGAISAGLSASNLISALKPEDLSKFFESRLSSTQYLLVKGSRGSQMERLVELLKAEKS
jgi:UDP-N-acetylmuramoyl-tripeptide--D-alanyl-D-alanine ligase